MRIGIQTWGSQGDIRPFLALAEGLQAAGHQVHLVITCVDSTEFNDLHSIHGVKITSIGSPVINTEQATQIGKSAWQIRNPMKQMAAILQLCYAPVEELMFETAQRLSADNELLIGHYFLHPLQIAAEQAKRPYVSVLLSHGAIPSSYNNPLNIAVLGKTGNRLLWWLAKLTVNRAMQHYPNRLRRRLGLPLTQDVMTQTWISNPLTLLAVSPQICHPYPDWPASVHACGFFDLPNPSLNSSLPDTVNTFLDTGEVPVYMTLGSWMPKDLDGQRETLQLLTQAAKLAGCRAIIQGASWQACGFQSCQRLLYIDAASHHAVFPHCRAIVHHGGAGTTQSATLAGKPSIVIAHISEQEHWGRELRRIGIADTPTQRRNITVEKLAQRIRNLTPTMAEKAQRTAAAMRHENGVAEAVRLIGQRFGM